MLLFVIDTVRSVFPESDVEVWIPIPGPLSRQIQLDFPEVAVRFEPTAVLRRYDFRRLNFSALFRMAFFPGWISRFSAYDCILVNTIVIWDVLLALRFVKRRKLVYVHEAPKGFSRHIFRHLLRWSGAEQVFVSHAAQQSVGRPGNVSERVIWNGANPIMINGAENQNHRNELHLLQIGRISASKGQQMLLDALIAMPEEARTLIRLRIVGDAFGEDSILVEALHAMVRDSGLSTQVTFHPFVPDTAAHFAWADAIVIPSLQPESFGLVAIEAMSAGRPVMAAAHGGLLEIVDHDVTGWLFPPGDVKQLSRLLLNATAMDRGAFWAMGAAGRRRYDTFFSTQLCREAWIALLEEGFATS
jgi:glycosyltransferase involved in cell wall biosynthesis